MTVLLSLSAYVPHWRLSSETITAAWGSAPGRGRRAVADRDEDAVTMAVEATLAFDASRLAEADAVYFASASAPYIEKQNASVIATTIGSPANARTVDLTGSRRAWLTGLALAHDSLQTGAVHSALVTTGEVRPAEPHSADELLFGDAGGAALLAVDGDGAEILGAATFHADDLGSWRRPGDAHVVHGEQRFALATAELHPATQALAAALDHAGLTIGDISVLAVSASQRVLAGRLAKQLGFDGKIVTDGAEPIGYAGTAHPVLTLAAALDSAEPGQHVAVVAAGDGADALILRASAQCRLTLPQAAPAGVERDIRYASYLRSRGSLAHDTEPPRSSSVAHHRDMEQTLQLKGMLCHDCGEKQYPITHRCAYCGTDNIESVALTRSGVVETFTSDHIVAGINPGNGEGVVTMAVVDLDSGGRVFVQCVSEFTDIEIGQRVNLAFRHLHDGSGFKNYYWKATPAATQGATHGNN